MLTFLHRSMSILTVVAVVSLTACSSTSQPDEGAGTAHENTDATYPMKIETPYGSSTLEAQPDRVVVVGPNDVDAVLALGVVPVGAAGWGDYSEPAGSWAPYYGDTSVIEKTLEPIAGGADFEEVLALQPDLIIAVGGIEELNKGYGELAKIAPVVTYPEKLDSWAVGDPLIALRTIAKPLDKTDEAEALISEYEGKLAELKTTHPEFEGKTISLVGVIGDSGLWLHSTKDSAAEQFLGTLGFVPNPGTEKVMGEIPEEKYGLIDSDVLVTFDNNGSTSETIDHLRKNPLFSELNVIKDGASLHLDDHDELRFAGVPLSNPSVPGLIWLLDVLPEYLAPAATAADAAKQ